jgi:hypothetical protein
MYPVLIVFFAVDNLHSAVSDEKEHLMSDLFVQIPRQLLLTECCREKVFPVHILNYLFDWFFSNYDATPYKFRL